MSLTDRGIPLTHESSSSTGSNVGPKNTAPTVHFSFDVEDWFQVENLRAQFPPESWDDQELRVEANTKCLLDLLGHHGITATFFVLGWIAERLPSLIKEICSQGHEIASHGYAHILNSDLSRKAQKEDVEWAKKLLEDITGKAVIGYRAPAFSVSDRLLEVLAETGYTYDSSYNDFAANSRYGKLEGILEEAEDHAKVYSTDNPAAPPADLFPFPRKSLFRHQSGIIECPMPITRIAGFKVPISGGGYFRLLPSALFFRLAASYIRSYGRYVFYLHPWEIDAAQPRVRGLNPGYRFRHYYKLGSTYRKLDHFIRYMRVQEWNIRPLAEIAGKSEDT